jgi:inhibitor of cysteine peptidase
MKAFLIFGLLLALLPGVTMAEKLEVHEGDAGKELILRRHDILRVVLPSNPTTGYSWSVVSFPAGLLQEFTHTRYDHLHHYPRLVGAGGEQIWKFLAVAAGNTTLKFSYARPWEHGVAPVKTKTWKIIVQ